MDAKPPRIEDYALISDCQTAALVSRECSIDWLCLPRFDSGACFAALLGSPDNGRWQIKPAGPVKNVSRRYRGDTLVLETTFETDEGTVCVVDFMPIRSQVPDIVRIVQGIKGKVRMCMEFVARFDYGQVVPWVRKDERGIRLIAGPDRLQLRTDVPLTGENFKTIADFMVSEGDQVLFDLTWSRSYDPAPKELNELSSLADTEQWWLEWANRCTYQGEWKEAVLRSLITLKALTYAPTGGIVAAPTASLPEQFGGVRNWDYRYCWLRDSTFTLAVLLKAGYTEEAIAWREWLLRAVAGRPDQLNIVYGLAGERRLTEVELTWLHGFAGSKPVRIGNGAYSQFQLDVYGEVLDSMLQSVRMGEKPEEHANDIQRALLNYLETAWQLPDEGVWEVRGPRRHFTHSKVMAWVAMDRAVKQAHLLGDGAPVKRWRTVRDEIHKEICEKGFDAGLNSFVQFYGSKLLDSSLLMMPIVGFLPASDPRMTGTIDAIQRELARGPFVWRYQTVPEVDGLPPGEGAFLLCSFWLADCLCMLGRNGEARKLFEQILAIRNDLGLLAEGYDVHGSRFTGNFPQAYSHVGLINTAMRLSNQHGAERHEPCKP
ncbi:MAG: glycoside hydrolase family 15 protein [Terriglobales bacterium]